MTFPYLRHLCPINSVLTFEETLSHFLSLVSHASAVFEVEGQVWLRYWVMSLFPIYNQGCGRPHMSRDLFKNMIHDPVHSSVVCACIVNI